MLCTGTTGSYHPPHRTREYTRRPGFPQPVHRQQYSTRDHQPSSAEKQDRTDPEPSFTFRNDTDVSADMNQRDIYFRVRQLPRARVIRSWTGVGGCTARVGRGLEGSRPSTWLVTECDVHVFGVVVAGGGVRARGPPVV